MYKDAEFIKIPSCRRREGTVKALIDNLDGKMVNIKVKDPLMRDINSFYGISGDGKTAVIEMAAASGSRFSAWTNVTLKATTFGTGELIKDALEKGCRGVYYRNRRKCD